MLQPLAFLFAWTTAKAEELDRRETGATATEYALIIAGIAVVIVGALALFGGNLATFWSGLTSKLKINS